MYNLIVSPKEGGTELDVEVTNLGGKEFGTFMLQDGEYTLEHLRSGLAMAVGVRSNADERIVFHETAGEPTPILGRTFREFLQTTKGIVARVQGKSLSTRCES